MQGIDYSQTRIADIENLTARLAQLAVNNSLSPIYTAVAQQLADMKTEARLWLTTAPPSPWNAQLAVVANG